MAKKNANEPIFLSDVQLSKLELEKEEEIANKLLAEKSRRTFFLNKVICNLKQEIRKLFQERLNIEENYFCPIDEYLTNKTNIVRTINFDNADNNTIYKLKNDFVEDKLNLMSEIIYEIDIDGFYAFNNFFMRDTLLTKNSFPLVQTLDINLKLKTAEEKKEEVVINKLKSCLQLIAEAAENITETYNLINLDNTKAFNCESINIIKFKEYFTEQKNIAKDLKIENALRSRQITLFEGWKQSKSKHFTNWFETDSNINYKILIKINKQIYDLGYINIFNDLHLINIVLSWNSILLISFNEKSWSKLLNIPDSLISIEEE